ncbi:MAG TPA: gluconate 2-dehydrogenase subunit 3 family protein [Puia sp.]|nr:gluconate 2-dehydrogenase subunit 3 family protein [Puia sp.]
MDRRKSIKAMLIGGVSTGILVDACQNDKKSEETKSPESVATDGINRMKEEQTHDKELLAATYFTPHEMATIAILADIIIPKDEVSGSATDAKVPDFIEIIVKDMPEHQVPMRGGIRWIDMQCLRRYNNSFRDCTREQQMQLVDEIAWPKKAKSEMAQGVSFFNLMRNLTATGFYTSAIGVKDVGYIGNMPNQWNGVPEDVLKHHNMAYSEKELKECISF